jgi:hypothetical protein
MVVQDGAALLEATVDVEGCGRNALEEVLEEKHVEGLGKNGARGTRAGIGGEVGVDDEDAEEAVGTLGADDGFEKLAKDAVLRAHCV